MKLAYVVTSLSIAVLAIAGCLAVAYPSTVPYVAIAGALVSLGQYTAVIHTPRCRARRVARRWHAALVEDRRRRKVARGLQATYDVLRARGRGHDYATATVEMLALAAGVPLDYVRKENYE